MTAPSTLAGWVTHCREQAETWDTHTRQASNAGALELAEQHDDDAAAWRALAELANHNDDVDDARAAAAVARVAVHLPTTDGSTR